MNNEICKNSFLEREIEPQKRSLRILLTSISSDSHTWNLVFLQLLMEKHGHTVINLGCCVTDTEIINSSYEETVDLVVVSTVNGHGYIEGNRLISAFKQDNKIAHIPVVIGGKIGISGKDNVKHYPELLQNGFDEVFDDSSDLSLFVSYMGKVEPVNRYFDQLLPLKGAL